MVAVISGQADDLSSGVESEVLVQDSETITRRPGISLSRLGLFIAQNKMYNLRKY
jgi:hypothetical protein